MSIEQHEQLQVRVSCQPAGSCAEPSCPAESSPPAALTFSISLSSVKVGGKE
jgi:hypothetical protein